MAEGLRERRRRQTRGDVANVAIDLVLERGLAGVRIEDIAAAAGISRSTFFNYFRDKEDALVFGPPLLSEEALDRYLVSSSAPVRIGLLDLLSDYGRANEDRRPGLVRMNRVTDANPELLGRVYGDFVIFHAGVSGALLRRFPDEEVYANAVGGAATGVIYVSMQRWLAEGETVSLEQALRDSFAAVGDLFHSGREPRARQRDAQEEES